MSASKKARMPPPGDKEVMALHDKYGRDMCDGLADSLKKDSNKTGYKHVYAQSGGTYSFYAKVHDIKAGKEVCLGSFYTAYAAAVTAALCTTKGKQDERDANLLCGCLTSRRSRSFCTRSMSEKHTLNE